MGFAKQISQDQSEESQLQQDQRDKAGNYVTGTCSHCDRQRVMVGVDGKHRCEKCAWCLEDNDFDYDFLSYIK